MNDLPSGTLTFLCSDVEGSTHLWELHADQMLVALAIHDAIVVAAVEDHDGHIVKPARGGDSFLAVFRRAPDAVAACLAMQRALCRHQWPAETPIRVRMALHTGEAELRDDQYYGVDVNRCARLMAIAHGGQTLVARSTYELAVGHLPPDTVLRSCGPHRLKDLRRPEGVFELCHPDLPDQFPPLRSLGALPNNLPLRLDSFIGRQAEAESIIRAIAGARIVTLTGPGGIGKSRLALHVAAEEVESFDAGVWWVDLAALSQPDDIPRALAAVLGVRDEVSEPLVFLLARFLADRAALLVLDNAEHLRADCASIAEQLLERCRDLRVLTTTREPLGLPGELVWLVPPLALDAPADGDAPPDEVGGHDPGIADAVALFVDRTRLVRPGYRPSGHDREAVVDICRQLDGIPLAIELAAARMSVLSPGDILARLPDRFRLLTSKRPSERRHPSLASVIELSYETLSESERQLFNRLTVFASDFSLDAAERVGTDGVAASGEVFDLLAGLVRKSMIMATEDASGRTRYRFLETLRIYGREHLSASGDSDAAHRAMADFYTGFVEAAEPELTRVGDEAVRRISAEHDNLRAALRWAVAQGDADVALRLAGILGRYWYVGGHLREGKEWLEACLSMPEASSVPTAVRARAFRAAGTLAYALGQSAAAGDFYQHSLEGFRADGDRAGEARALNDLAVLQYQSGQLDAARSLYDQSLRIKRELGDTHGVANTLANLGLVAHWAGELDRAEVAFVESLDHARAAGGDRLVAKVVLHLAGVSLAHGDLVSAQERCEEGLQRHRALGDQAGTALALVALGRTLREAGEAHRAMDAVEQGRTVAESIGYRWGVADALEVKASLHADAGEWDTAWSELLASKAVWEEIGDQQSLANVHDVLGRVALARGDWRQAARLHRDCLVIRMGLDSPSPLMCCVCIEDLVGVLAMSGQHENAANLAGAASAHRQRCGVPLTPMARRRMDGHLTAVRNALGEDGLADCLAAGRSLSLDAALQQALELATALAGPDSDQDAPDAWSSADSAERP